MPARPSYYSLVTGELATEEAIAAAFEEWHIPNRSDYTLNTDVRDYEILPFLQDNRPLPSYQDAQLRLEEYINSHSKEIDFATDAEIERFCKDIYGEDDGSKIFSQYNKEFPPPKVKPEPPQPTGIIWFFATLYRIFGIKWLIARLLPEREPELQDLPMEPQSVRSVSDIFSKSPHLAAIVSKKSGKILPWANINEIDVDRTDYSDTNLNGVSFAGMRIGKSSDGKGPVFLKANLRGANFTGTIIKDGADFSNADLAKATFFGARATNANFTGANLSGINFSGTHSVATIDNAIFQDTIFAGESRKDFAHNCTGDAISTLSNLLDTYFRAIEYRPHSSNRYVFRDCFTPFQNKWETSAKYNYQKTPSDAIKELLMAIYQKVRTTGKNFVPMGKNEKDLLAYLLKCDDMPIKKMTAAANRLKEILLFIFEYTDLEFCSLAEKQASAKQKVEALLKEVGADIMSEQKQPAPEQAPVSNSSPTTQP